MNVCSPSFIGGCLIVKEKGGERMIIIRESINILEHDKKYVAGKLHQQRNQSSCSCNC